MATSYSRRRRHSLPFVRARSQRTSLFQNRASQRYPGMSESSQKEGPLPHFRPPSWTWTSTVRRQLLKGAGGWSSTLSENETIPSFERRRRAQPPSIAKCAISLSSGYMAVRRAITAKSTICSHFPTLIRSRRPAYRTSRLSAPTAIESFTCVIRLTVSARSDRCGGPLNQTLHQMAALPRSLLIRESRRGRHR